MYCPPTSCERSMGSLMIFGECFVVRVAVPRILISVRRMIDDDGDLWLIELIPTGQSLLQLWFFIP